MLARREIVMPERRGRFDESPEETERQINYLIEKIPIKTFKEVWTLMQKDKYWCLKLGFFFGMYVRNLLREVRHDWDPWELDDIYHWYLRKALIRIMESPEKRKFITEK